MSEDEAYRRRVTGARLVRRFPIALEMIERGEIRLTALLLLKDYLTVDSHEELLRAVRDKTKNEILHLLAKRFPRPDVPSLIQPVAGTQRLPMEHPPDAPNTAQGEIAEGKRIEQEMAERWADTPPRIETMLREAIMMLT
jgi:hypothetical protein